MVEGLLVQESFRGVGLVSLETKHCLAPKIVIGFTNRPLKLK